MYVGLKRGSQIVNAGSSIGISKISWHTSERYSPGTYPKRDVPMILYA